MMFFLVVLIVMWILCSGNEQESCAPETCLNDARIIACHSNETDLWLDGTGAKQNVGIGFVPEEISAEIREVICRMNVYLAHDILPKLEYKLVDCSNRHEMCAYWKTRGRCDSKEYMNYMSRECPLACQTCGTELRRGSSFLLYLMNNLTDAYHPEAAPDDRSVVSDRHRTLFLLMEDLGMDPGELLGKSLQKQHGNWLFDLHHRIMAVIPQALLELYSEPSLDTDLSLLASLHGMERVPHSQLLQRIGIPYRDRGQIISIMQATDHLITRPMQLGVGFSIPNAVAIERLQELGPLIHMGAGSGYWSALLRHAGVDLIAYDVHPPHTDKNAFFEVTYTDEILPGACVDVLSSSPELARTRALLIIWPNDPDPIDNTQFCTGKECEGSQLPWDGDCLDAYVQAGGFRVIYVGEREASIRVRHPRSSPDSGISSTRRFQQTLLQQFDLLETVSIPKMWLNEDDLSIWELKAQSCKSTNSVP
jgi:hypothetical protein